METERLAAEYEREIETLRAKLAEATQIIETENRNKAQMQENLQQAFMRGVCALNLEAMSALNPGAKAPKLFSIDPAVQMEQNSSAGQCMPVGMTLPMSRVEVAPRNDLARQSESGTVSMPKNMYDAIAVRSMEQIDAQLAVSPAKSLDAETSQLEQSFRNVPEAAIAKEVRQPEAFSAAKQPETKVIRVNKYGKSYADSSTNPTSKSKSKPSANKKKPLK